MNKLKFDIKPFSNPYPDDSSSRCDIWSDIYIKIICNDNSEILLQYISWDIKYFIEWFIENYKIFSKEEIKLPKLERESLAEVYIRSREETDKLYDFEEEEDREYTNEENEQVELMLLRDIFYGDIFSSRLILCGFNGYEVPQIIIGINKGDGEISLVDKETNTNWKYNFDMQDFVKNTLIEMRNALLIYKENYYNPLISNIYDELFESLNKHIKELD